MYSPVRLTSNSSSAQFTPASPATPNKLQMPSDEVMPITGATVATLDYKGDVDSEGRPNGKGILQYPSDDAYGRKSYEGEWSHGKWNGRGKIVWISGTVFDGELRDGKMHGQATITWEDGSSFTGTYRDGKRSGYGVYNYAPNDVYLRVKYEGDWKDGKKCGKGRLSWFVGDFYEGDWSEGKRHGFGVFQWADGARFEGEWEGGMRHGKGIYIWPDGEAFEGMWRSDKKHGVGILTRNDGTKTGEVWEYGHRMNPGIRLDHGRTRSTSDAKRSTQYLDEFRKHVLESTELRISLEKEIDSLRAELEKKDEQLSFLKWELIKADGKIDTERINHQAEVAKLKAQIEELKLNAGQTSPRPTT